MPSAPQSPSACPPDVAETAEAYAMRRLSTADALKFAIHCLTCRPCAAAAQEVDGFARAMKGAARRLRGSPALDRVCAAVGHSPALRRCRLGAYRRRCGSM